MSIEWQEGAVCFAGGGQRDAEYLKNIAEWFTVGVKDFQLNTIKQGDYIEASELDTEQKYNDAVEVFGLFGFDVSVDFEWFKDESCRYDLFFMDEYKDLDSSVRGYRKLKRKLTYQQIMAIGELKRFEIKRDKEPKFGKNEDGSMKLIKSNLPEIPDSCEDEKPPYYIEKDGGKYHREIIGLDGTKTTVDVYRILDAFNTGCAATDHAIKKMLCAGLRGHKDKLTDYDNAIESLQAAKELLVQKDSNANTN